MSDEVVTIINTRVGDILIYRCSVSKKEYNVEVIKITECSIIVKVLSDIKYKDMEFIGFKSLRFK